ncbi:MAG: hypothetical protein EHM59_21385, partial [Betaproteobacteria bacterium]
ARHCLRPGDIRTERRLSESAGAPDHSVFPGRRVRQHRTALRASAGGGVEADHRHRQPARRRRQHRTKHGRQSDTRRLHAALHAPTFEEAGVPGMIAQNWFGLMGPATLPRAVVNLINAETHKAVSLPEVRERLAASGIEPMLGSPEDFMALLQSEYARWGKVVKSAGIKAD